MVLHINAAAMEHDGILLCLSQNGVWLCQQISTNILLIYRNVQDHFTVFMQLHYKAVQNKPTKVLGFLYNYIKTSH